ncbi:PPR: pentatricopeptide repeat domain containing protein [Nitzschia inconspicua]|uniref:PPR: pentatricopeptide repeat domain containing protein n=1 Tax=Nitzschia inconspicua TaxID=303405 RepID=A0A9K3PX12_9STRA|nr:PPR: pentatricopeptide repeat domain containing protein [Nitzschia inconspicua]
MQLENKDLLRRVADGRSFRQESSRRMFVRKIATMLSVFILSSVWCCSLQRSIVNAFSPLAVFQPFHMVAWFNYVPVKTPAVRHTEQKARTLFYASKSLGQDGNELCKDSPKKKEKQQRSSQSSSRRVSSSGKDSPEWLKQKLDCLRNSKDVENFLSNYLNESSQWVSWAVRDQIEFIKYLGTRRASQSILPFVDALASHGRCRSLALVKMYTSALFAISHCTPPYEDATDIAWGIMDRMIEKEIKPTSLTLVGLLRNIRGGPATVSDALQKVEAKFPSVAWDADVYHAAIHACRHRQLQKGGVDFDSIDNYKNDKSWQMALHLMQNMQRKHRIQPTSSTYLAVLQVMADSGKIPMIRSVIRQWRNSKAGADEHTSDDRIWATAMIACARIGDFRQATEFLQEMESPNLRHCTSLLLAFANAGEDQLAVEALNLMIGSKEGSMQVPGCTKPLSLPLIDPDLVALNTVISASAKGGNYSAARDLFDRIRNGQFPCPGQKDSMSTESLSPDRISYHNLLVSCCNPMDAKEIVKDMRLSRRYRYGATPPTNVTYSHAIRVCQRAVEPDLETTNVLLEWAKDDGVKPTAFMYGPAIWTAQRCGDVNRCLELYEEMKNSGCPIDNQAVNGVLSALAGRRDEQLTLTLFDEMKCKGFSLFETTLRRLVSMVQSNVTSLSEDKEQKLLFILKRLSQSERNVKIGGAVFEALISLYGCRHEVDKAISIANQIEGYWDAPCLRAMLLAYASCPDVRWKEAVELLHISDIVEGASGPGLIDQIALSHVLIACSKANEFDEGLSLLQLYGIPVERMPAGIPSMMVGAINALIASAGRGGCPEVSLAILNDMKSQYGIIPDARSYRSAIIACNQAQHGKKIYGRKIDGENDVTHESGPVVEWWEISLSLLYRMDEDGLTPDVQTYSSVISACEAAGQWQRALSVLQSLIEDAESQDPECDSTSLNLYCWNAAISACEKGGAWVEALDLYERMLETDAIMPNVVTMNSLLEALEKFGQRELAQTKYEEGLELGIVNPWRRTKSATGKPILALDFHSFSSAMTKAALRHVIDTWLDESDTTGGLHSELVIVTGKGLNSASEPVLRKTVTDLLQEYGIEGKVDETNAGRVIVDVRNLLECFDSRSWR